MDPHKSDERPDQALTDSASMTPLLERVSAGDEQAVSELYQRVYRSLRAMAAQHMGHERVGHTLQPTALVHEAYAKLFGAGAEVRWNDSAHFFRTCAQCMRRILVDHAKARNRVKRGGDVARVEGGTWLADLQCGAIELARDGDPATFLAVEEAICRLEEEDREAGEVVRLRYFAGLTEEEIARGLGLSERTVRRRWTFAKAWLFEVLKAHDRPEIT